MLTSGRETVLEDRHPRLGKSYTCWVEGKGVYITYIIKRKVKTERRSSRQQ